MTWRGLQEQEEPSPLRPLNEYSNDNSTNRSTHWGTKTEETETQISHFARRKSDTNDGHNI